MRSWNHTPSSLYPPTPWEVKDLTCLPPLSTCTFNIHISFFLLLNHLTATLSGIFFSLCWTCNILIRAKPYCHVFLEGMLKTTVDFLTLEARCLPSTNSVCTSSRFSSRLLSFTKKLKVWTTVKLMFLCYWRTVLHKHARKILI